MTWPWRPLYRLHQARPPDTICLALFDEAFGKMDTARTASVWQFMVNSQLQVLLATPPDKAAGPDQRSLTHHSQAAIMFSPE